MKRLSHTKNILKKIITYKFFSIDGNCFRSGTAIARYKIKIYFQLKTYRKIGITEFTTRKDSMKRQTSLFGLVLLMFTLYTLLLVTPAFAVPIVFNLGYGGIVSYAGGSNPFVTTNGAVRSVSNGSTSISITGGDLDFMTGTYLIGSGSSTLFTNYYNPGGLVTISGNSGSGFSTLLLGSFADVSTFNCCSGSSPFFVSSFSGLFSVSYIDPRLAAALGFNLPPTGGSIAQVQIYFSSAPRGPGAGFRGVQGGGAVAVTDSIPVPEPASLLLVGSGLLALWLWKCRKHDLCVFRNVISRLRRGG